MRAIALAFLLCGCAAHWQRQADNESTSLLCYVQLAGNPNEQRLAGNSLRARGASCTPYLVEAGRQEIENRRASQARSYEALGAAGAAILNQPQYVPPSAPPAQVHCQTIRTGNVTNTYCN